MGSGYQGESLINYKHLYRLLILEQDDSSGAFTFDKPGNFGAGYSTIVLDPQAADSMLRAGQNLLSGSSSASFSNLSKLELLSIFGNTRLDWDLALLNAWPLRSANMQVAKELCNRCSTGFDVIYHRIATLVVHS